MNHLVVDSNGESLSLRHPCRKSEFSAWATPTWYTRRTRTEIIRLILLGVLGLLVYLGFHDYQFDDPFITFRVAENIASGNGWVFNPGEHFNAATSPLWTLLLAVAHLITGIPIPSLGPSLSILFLIAAADLAGRALAPRLPGAAAALASIFIVVNPNFALTAGMETMLLFVTVLAAVAAYIKEKWTATALFLAVAILTRMDAAVLAAIMALHFVLTRRRFFPLPAIIAFALPLAVWFGFSAWYFGALEPTTLAVKIAQRRSGGHWGAGYILLNHLGLILQKNFLSKDPLNLLLLALLGIGLATLVQRRSFAGLVLVAWAVGHVLAYGIILNVPGYAWYFAPIFLAIQVVLATGTARLLETQGWPRRIWPWLGGLLLIVWAISWFGFGSKAVDKLLTPVHLNHFLFYLATAVLALPESKTTGGRRLVRGVTVAAVAAAAIVPNNINGWLQATHFPHPQYRNYTLAAGWIKQHLPQARSVGTSEIGILGWYLPGVRIIDQCGIASPGAAEHLGNGDFTWWLRRYRPDAIVLHPDMVYWKHLEEPIKSAPWFVRAYRLDATFEAGRSGPPWSRQAVEIWEKVDDAVIPATTAD